MSIQPAKRFNVLIVDDVRQNRKLLRYMLEDNGFNCYEAANGAEAVALVEQEPSLDVILMDIKMPVMDGREAAARIKAMVVERHLPIIFVTSLNDDDILTRCLEEGGDDFVPKPMTEGILMAKVMANLRTAQLHRQLSESNEQLRYHSKMFDRELAIVEQVFNNSMQRANFMECRNLHYRTTPMSMFNGDLLLHASNPSGGLYVLLGDFSGHGLSAAIGCLPVADIFHAMTRKHAEIGDIAYEINRRLMVLLPKSMFFCAVLLEFSRDGRRMRYWSGGMHDLLIIGEQGGVTHRLSAQHLPLGVLPAAQFDRATDALDLCAGTKLFAYTDGVIEAPNAEGEMFGIERLERLLETPCTSLVDRISEEVERFQDHQIDDVTLLQLDVGPIVHEGVGGQSQRQEILSTEQVSLPWRLQLHLGVRELQQDNIVSRIIAMMSHDVIMAADKDILHTLFSELYNNSLEHGVLGLDSALKSSADGFQHYYELRKARLESLTEGSIDIAISLTGPINEMLEIMVTDSGKGFDYEKLVKQSVSYNSFGRGFELIKSLCQEVSFSDGGRTIKVYFPLRS